MTPLRQRMLDDMQLRGLARKTQAAYALAVRQLAEHYGKSPDQISEEELGEVQRILSCLEKPAYRACLSVIYGCGLRLQEGIGLQVRDVDSERMCLHVRRGKGGKDRYVPLPESVLPLLRAYWCTHRHPTWLFPAKATPGASAKTTLCHSGVQRAFKAALHTSGVHKAATVHTLRHFLRQAQLAEGCAIMAFSVRDSGRVYGRLRSGYNHKRRLARRCKPG
jgi:integrase